MMEADIPQYEPQTQAGMPWPLGRRYTASSQTLWGSELVRAEACLYTASRDVELIIFKPGKFPTLPGKFIYALV